MVTVRLIGGLGNQMFQYAVGRALAARHEVPLELDLSGFGEYTLHSYSLDRLRITASIADAAKVARLRRRDYIGWIRSLFGPLGATAGRVKERAFHFDPSVLNACPPIYLEGYWQSEKYFVSAAHLLREEFQLRAPMDKWNHAIAAQIRDCESVAVHVRRGDYVNNLPTNSVHGVCGPEYYARACDIVAAHVTKPKGFIFSDDIEWARQNLRLPFPSTFVDLNGSDRNYIDLHLMAACRHQIIANSSFSWWAAWLNRSPSKTVVAPQRWFRQERFDTRDLLPAAWLTA